MFQLQDTIHSPPTLQVDPATEQICIGLMRSKLVKTPICLQCQHHTVHFSYTVGQQQRTVPQRERSGRWTKLPQTVGQATRSAAAPGERGGRPGAHNFRAFHAGAGAGCF